MQTRARFLRALSLLLVLAAGCGDDTASRVYVIKFPHVTAPATPKGQTAERFKALAEARFPGRVRVEVYPSGQLMEGRDAIEALAFGEIQLIAETLSIFNRHTGRFEIFDLPFLFPNLAAVERFQRSEEGQALLDSLSGKGIQGLTFWHNGMKHFSGPVPLRLPEDASGLKFRIMESDVLQAQVEAVGGSPQKMAYGEVYQALQTGTVDAQENTWSNIYSSKFYEVQPFISESNHGYLGYFVATNTEFWTSLPDDIRIGLEEILEEVTGWGNARAGEINAEARQAVIDSGRSEVVDLDAAELAAWRAAMAPVWDQFRDVIGADLIDAARSITESE
ncbi:MAG TPA: DctP family TRAP transporter solute-binding subunit [Gammaproteobacteria bacterium]|nr:DctP family TRAP transporter solute-binding subunit [Gammaproteobacteria bacterium]